MQWANALSTRPSLESAVADVVERAFVVALTFLGFGPGIYFVCFYE
jgi:small ligand-binding sensory domain FIST